MRAICPTRVKWTVKRDGNVAHSTGTIHRYKKKRIGINSRVFSWIERVPLSTLCKEVKLHPTPLLRYIPRKKKKKKDWFQSQSKSDDHSFASNHSKQTTYSSVHNIYVHVSGLSFHLSRQNLLLMVFIIFNKFSILYIYICMRFINIYWYLSKFIIILKSICLI